VASEQTCKDGDKGKDEGCCSTSIRFVSIRETPLYWMRRLALKRGRAINMTQRGGWILTAAHTRYQAGSIPVAATNDVNTATAAVSLLRAELIRAFLPSEGA